MCGGSDKPYLTLLCACRGEEMFIWAILRLYTEFQYSTLRRTGQKDLCGSVLYCSAQLQLKQKFVLFVELYLNALKDNRLKLSSR